MAHFPKTAVLVLSLVAAVALALPLHADSSSAEAEPTVELGEAASTAIEAESDDVLDFDALAGAQKACDATCEANCEQEYQDCLVTNPKCAFGSQWCGCSIARTICLNACCG